jgi:hypothetical protein
MEMKTTIAGNGRMWNVSIGGPAGLSSAAETGSWRIALDSVRETRGAWDERQEMASTPVVNVECAPTVAHLSRIVTDKVLEKADRKVEDMGRKMEVAGAGPDLTARMDLRALPLASLVAAGAPAPALKVNLNSAREAEDQPGRSGKTRMITRLARGAPVVVGRTHNR